jgi:hypothetical protein
MSMSPETKLQKKRPWVVAILLAVVLDLALLGTWGGECFDYTTESGAESSCTVGPAIGPVGAWFFGAVSLLAIAYFTYRLIRAFKRI